MIAELKNTLLDFCYPPFCVGCDADRGWFCLNCINGIVESSPAHKPPDGFADFFVVGAYADPRLRELIHALKYRRATACREGLAQLLKAYSAKHVLFRQLIEKHELNVFHVPSDELRIRERGIDHARALAEVFGTVFPKVKLRSSLIKTRPAMANAALPSNAAREGNTKDAFAVTERVGDACLIIDDVYTTGATMNACKRALRAAGAHEIYAFALAKG